MRIIVASSNQGKLREIAQIFSHHEVVGYHEVLEPFEVVEDGDSFKENALIKARAIYAKLSQEQRESCVVLSDDSGISLPLLGGAPGIYSARYAGEPLDPKRNLEKLMQEIKNRGLSQTPAHYTAAIALIYQGNAYTVHGWMYGTALANARGDKGFGYDPMFVPLGENRTLAEMEESEKNRLSHRAQALSLAESLLKSLTKLDNQSPLKSPLIS